MSGFVRCPTCGADCDYQTGVPILWAEHEAANELVRVIEKNLKHMTRTRNELIKATAKYWSKCLSEEDRIIKAGVNFITDTSFGGE